jgi:hypothetical protein
MPIQLNPTSSSGWKTVVKPVAKPVTPAPSPVKPDLSLTREWKPTHKQFKVDQLHLQRFDLKDTLMTAQYNYDAVLGNPKSTKTDINQAENDLRNAKSRVDKFEKKNPKLKTASFELDALISQYTKGGFNIPTKIKNAARDMIGGFWDGVYPSKNSIKAMLTQLSDAAPKPDPKPKLFLEGPVPFLLYQPKLPLKGPDLNNVYKMVIGTYDTIQDEYGNQFKLEGFERLGPDGKIIQAKGLRPLPKSNTIG